MVRVRVAEQLSSDSEQTSAVSAAADHVHDDSQSDTLLDLAPAD